MAPFKVILLILSTFTLANCERRIQRMTVNQMWTYVYRGFETSFNDTVTWCKSLGGQLPSIHSQEDIDWIAKAVGRTSPMPRAVVWLGMRIKLVNGKCQLDKWMDGTPYDYKLSWSSPCEDDVNIEDAMVMWLDGDFPKVLKNDVTYSERSVCVLKYPSVPEQINGIKAMVESMNNSIQMQINRVNETINEVKQEIPKQLNTTNEVRQDTKKLLDDMSEMKSRMNYIFNYLFDGLRTQAKSNIIAMKNVMENLEERMLNQIN